MDTTQIIIAIISALAGIAGTLFSRNSKKEENNLSADDFTFKSLQSENQRLYKQVNALLKDKEMLVQQIDVLQITFNAEIEALQSKIKTFKGNAEQLELELNELKNKINQ